MGNGSQGKTFLKNTGVVTVSHVGGAVAATIAGILTARYLGPEGKGQVALAMSTGMVLAVILRLGFHEAAPYYIASGRLAPKRVLGCWILTFIIAMVFFVRGSLPFICLLFDGQCFYRCYETAASLWQSGLPARSTACSGQ